ncbi:hypothetical protein SVAN01_05605 [Stagonosporopsis vannaccii]|nr:hypothetical protein SVAN01_05605 [Stagonosporopsis vannaccii]
MVSMAAGFRASLSAVKLRTQSLAPNSFRKFAVMCFLPPPFRRAQFCAPQMTMLCADIRQLAARRPRRPRPANISCFKHWGNASSIFSLRAFPAGSDREADSLEAKCNDAQIHCVELACSVVQGCMCVSRAASYCEMRCQCKPHETHGEGQY